MNELCYWNRDRNFMFQIIWARELDFFFLYFPRSILFPESIGDSFKKTSPNCTLIFLDVEISWWSNIMLNNWQVVATLRASLVAQRVKHLPAMQETQVQSLGWEDPLEKEMATHSSTLAWKIPGTEKPLQSMGSQRVRQDWATSFHLATLMAESEEELKSLLLKVKRRVKKLA